jgi:hypothetical protein
MASDLDVIDDGSGRLETWLDLGPLYGAGWVCAEPDPGWPDDICGMPVEDVPCTIHHPGQED